MSDSCLYKINHGCAGDARRSVHYTRIIGRKRVFSSPFNTPIRKQRSRRFHSEASNRLEQLPQDILIRVLCRVNHGDIKQLIFVSKAIRDAALIAKELHFAFRTPTSKVTFKGDSSPEDVNEHDESHEAPNAPRRISTTRLGGKDLASIAVALFTSADEL